MFTKVLILVFTTLSLTRTGFICYTTTIITPRRFTVLTPFEDQLAYLPVPVRFLPDMTKLLSELIRNPDGEDEGAKIVPVPDPGATSSRDTFWTEDRLGELLLLLKPQNTVSLAVLDMAALRASNPGNASLVSFPEACAKGGLDVSQGKAHIGALRKVCGKVGSREFPVSEHWAEGGENIKYYRMSPDIAVRWLKVRAANP